MKSLNIFFNKALKKAEFYIEDQQFVSNLLDLAFAKMGKVTDRIYKVQDQILGLLRLLRAWVKRDYTDISAKALIAILAAVIYFVNPFDLITDLIPFIGFADDITIITYVVTVFNKEIERFMDWERANTAN